MIIGSCQQRCCGLQKTGCSARAARIGEAASALGVAFSPVTGSVHKKEARARSGETVQRALNSVLGLGALSFFVPSCFLHGLPWDTTRICPRPAQKDDEEQQK